MNRPHHHPLLQYPVIKQLMRHLDHEDLLSLRQVCLSWKHLFDSKLQNKTKVKIPSLSHLEKFLAEIISPQNFSFEAYELKNVPLEKTQSFFPTFGPNITSLNLHQCDWRSCTLRQILFKKLPHLHTFELSTDKNAGHWSDPLLPISFIPYGSFSPLVNLKNLRITGDYSNRTDLFYDLIKSSPNLETIRLAKFHPGADDLFGTWLTEIILSCDFPCLKSLELDCILIQQQVEALAVKKYPLRRLCFDLDLNEMDLTWLDRVLAHFRGLESVEVGMDNAPHRVALSIIRRFKNYKCWVAVQTTSGSKIVFPNHSV